MDVNGTSFRVPTTTAKEHVAVFADYPKKKNYKDTFDQATFTAPARLLPEMNANGKCKHDMNGNYSYMKQVTNHSVINLEYLFANDIYFESQPADLFDLFFLMKQTKETHTKAVIM